MGVEPKINSPALLEAEIWSKMYNISGGHLEMQKNMAAILKCSMAVIDTKS